MNKKEREALERAFDIPEPEKCNEFIEKLLEKENTDKRRGIVLFQRIPAVVRYSLAACLIIAVIGIIGNIGDLTDTDKYRKHEEPASVSSETTTTYTTEEESTIITTSAPPQDSYETTDTNTGEVKDITTVTTAKGNGENTKVTAKTNSTGNASGNTTAPRKTTASRKTTAVRKTTPARKTTPVRTTHKTSETSPSRATRTVTKKPDVIVTTSTVNAEPIVTSPTGKGTDDPPTTPTVGGSVDHTVEPPVRYDVKGRVYTDSDFNKSGPPESDSAVSPRLNELISGSDLIVIARVDEVIYTKINGKLTTQENVTVMETYYGDINCEDRISVYANGGYMPMSEYMPGYDNNGTYFNFGGNSTIAKEGDYYIYFLIKDKNSEAYRLYDGTDSSKYKYENNRYVCVGSGLDPITIRELRDRINDLK